MSNTKYTAEQRVEYLNRKMAVKLFFKDNWIKQPRVWLSGYLKQTGRDEIMSDVNRFVNFYHGKTMDYEYLELFEDAVSELKELFIKK